MNKELHAYIINQIQRGISQEEITNTLLANGWQIKDIDLAWLQITNSNYKEEDLENTRSQQLPNGTSGANSSEKKKVKKPHPLKVFLKFMLAFYICVTFVFLFEFVVIDDDFSKTNTSDKMAVIVFFAILFSIALLSLWWFLRDLKKY